MRIKTLILLICFLFTISWSYAQITFEKGSWEEVKAKAKKENKHIMVDAYTTWCGPCKWMSANTFTDEKVGEFYNEKYVNYKLDMEKEGDGLNFAKTYRIRAYPTIVFFNPQGDMVHKIVGAAPAPQFLVVGKEALDPDKQVFTLEKKYKAGEKEPEFLRNYAFALRSAYETQKSEEVAKDYLASQDKSTWKTAENWKFIQAFTTSMESETFKFVIANKADYKTLGEQEYDAFISNVLRTSIYQTARSQDEDKLADLSEKIKEVLGKDADKHIAQAKFIFYSNDKDFDKKMKYACKYLDNYSNNWQELNSMAWNVFEKSENPTHLEKALGWAKKSVSLEENFYNTDTYAHLLFKLDMAEDAKTWAEKAIKIGKADGESTKDTETLLSKIEAKLK